VGYSRWLIPKGNEFLPGATSIEGLVQRLRKEHWIVDASTLASSRFEGILEGMAASTGGLALRTVDNTFGKDSRARLLGHAEPQPWELSADWLDDPEREDLRLVWPVERGGVVSNTLYPLLYPLSLFPNSSVRDDSVRYALEIHRSSDYVYPQADDIGELPTECPCGDDLAFEWDEDELVPAFARSTGIFATCVACARTFEPCKRTATLIRPFDSVRSMVPGGAAYRLALKFESGAYVADPALAFHGDLVALVEEHFGRDFIQFASVS
jgi:hypothetical protein